MLDTCVFCGRQGDDFAPEHWFPNWLNRALFPDRASFGVQHNLPDRSWEADVFELVVSHVCRRCNETWMSTIESRARKYVLPLILGVADGQTINPQGLWHVARWCYLKTISLELGRPKDHEPTHDVSVYSAFRATRRPPYPNCSLALGIRDIEETSPVFVWFTSQGGHQFTSIPEGTADTEDGYHTTLLIGHLVLDVWGTTAPVRVTVDHGEGLHILWPLAHEGGGTFTWPPSRRFQWKDGLTLKP